MKNIISIFENISKFSLFANFEPLEIYSIILKHLCVVKYTFRVSLENRKIEIEINNGVKWAWITFQPSFGSV
jgi:hypothetical protein